MQTIMNQDAENIAIVEAYYAHMLRKEFDLMEKYLHPDVHFIGPLAEMKSRVSVVEAAKNLRRLLIDIHIRAKFSTGGQVMLAYDFLFPEPIGQLRAAVLMEINHHLITKIELFYDGRPFEEKRHEIFSKE